MRGSVPQREGIWKPQAMYTQRELNPNFSWKERRPLARGGWVGEEFRIQI